MTYILRIISIGLLFAVGCFMYPQLLYAIKVIMIAIVAISIPFVAGWVAREIVESAEGYAGHNLNESVSWVLKFLIMAAISISGITILHMIFG